MRSYTSPMRMGTAKGLLFPQDEAGHCSSSLNAPITIRPSTRASTPAAMQHASTKPCPAPCSPESRILRNGPRASLPPPPPSRGFLAPRMLRSAPMPQLRAPCRTFFILLVEAPGPFVNRVEGIPYPAQPRKGGGGLVLHRPYQYEVAAGCASMPQASPSPPAPAHTIIETLPLSMPPPSQAGLANRSHRLCSLSLFLILPLSA